MKNPKYLFITFQKTRVILHGIFFSATLYLYFSLSPSFHRFNKSQKSHMILRTLATRLTNLKNLHVNLKILLPQNSCSSKFFVCDMTKFLYYCSFLWKASALVVIPHLKDLGCCVIKILIFILIKNMIFWDKMNQMINFSKFSTCKSEMLKNWNHSIKLIFKTFLKKEAKKCWLFINLLMLYYCTLYCNQFETKMWLPSICENGYC